jgi:3-hydroxyanthranilate 3,4-dioxygenase
VNTTETEGEEMAEVLIPFDLMEWIDQNKASFNWPTGNKVIWPGWEFFAFVSGGNARNDFHISACDEVFLQLKGDVRVDLIDESGKRQPTVLREGHVLYIPKGVPHAPRRPQGTLGFIVERQRAENELDSWAWFCENCDHKLHEFTCHVKNMDTQFAEVLSQFNADEALRTCERCREVLPVPTEYVMEYPAVA